MAPIPPGRNIIDNLISELSDNDIAISGINKSISFETYYSEKEPQFFRARCSDTVTDYTRDEMLHIPFSKRSLVKTTRFSIPGLPCLYLGTSSYVCWLELGRPAEHMFNVSPVMLDNTQKILNLAINFGDFCGDYIISGDDRLKLLPILLLSMASSFKVKESGRTFQSEYIIPQMIMLSCMNKGLSGVTYYSKQVSNDLFAHSIGVNLALFATYAEGRELSEICNHLSISNSFNYSMYKQLKCPQTFRRTQLRADNIGCVTTIGTFELQHKYAETKFSDFDHYLYAYLPPTPYIDS